MVGKRIMSLILIGLGLCGPGSIAPSLAGRGQAGPGDPNTSTTASVDGSRGGTVRCGRWSVVVPPGAFEGVGEVSIMVLDRNGIVVDLGIKPRSLNAFAVPVELVCNTSGLGADASTLTIYLLDPSSGQWVDQQAAGDNGKQTVTARLAHFSTYRLGPLGKAGW